MSGPLVVVPLVLTYRQAEELEQIAVGKSLAGGDRLWAKVLDALREGMLYASQEASERESRRRSCPHCGRAVIYGRRGARGAPLHRCPHGLECRRSYCSKCAGARETVSKAGAK